MIRAAALFVVLWLALAVQSTLGATPGLEPYFPDLPLLFVVLAGMFRGTRAGLLYGLAIGLVADISYGMFLGQTAFALAAAGYLAGYGRSLFIRESRLLAILLAGVLNEVFLWISYGVSRLFGEVPIGPHAVLLQSAWSTLATMILVPFVYGVFRKRLGRRPRVRYDDESVES